MYQCHCSRCRKGRAAAHGANLFYKLEDFRWTCRGIVGRRLQGAGRRAIRRGVLPAVRRLDSARVGRGRDGGGACGAARHGSRHETARAYLRRVESPVVRDHRHDSAACRGAAAASARPLSGSASERARRIRIPTTSAPTLSPSTASGRRATRTASAASTAAAMPYGDASHADTTRTARRAATKPTTETIDELRRQQHGDQRIRRLTATSRVVQRGALALGRDRAQRRAVENGSAGKCVCSRAKSSCEASDRIRGVVVGRLIVQSPA